jgi:hypothetical protein
VVLVNVGIPVDEGQRRQDDIGREQVIGVRKEPRPSDSPDLPVEAIIVNITANLVTFVGVGLCEESAILCQTNCGHEKYSPRDASQHPREEPKCG